MGTGKQVGPTAKSGYRNKGIWTGEMHLFLCGGKSSNLVTCDSRQYPDSSSRERVLVVDARRKGIGGEGMKNSVGQWASFVTRRAGLGGTNIVR